jgi:osmotically-inducible protein OsmY
MPDVQSLLFIVMALFSGGSAAQGQPGAETRPVNLDFRQLDADKDGFISRKEAEQDADILRAFSRADTDRDGRLNEDEFVKARSIAQREKSARYAEDSAITTKVKAALLGAKGLPSTAISVETYKGRVQLSGFVDSGEQVAQAGAVAARVSGVTSVQNGLAVK